MTAPTPSPSQPTYLSTAAASVRAHARIKPHIYATPLIPARTFGHPQSSTVLFKAENFQLTSSFKIRGAMAKMSSPDLVSAAHLITASSGNHGIGAACASQLLGRRLTVVVPETVVPEKLDRIKGYGIEVVVFGAETGRAERRARELADGNAYVYVSPYNDPEVVAGQGTVGLEILDQCDKVDCVFVAMGGGGLIGGIGAVMKAFSPWTKVVGVSARNSMALAESIRAGRVVEVEHRETLADAVAGGIDEDAITVPLARAVVDELIECDEAEIAEALKALALDENMIVEGSAALALAGYIKVAEKVAGLTSVIVLCGANYPRDIVMKVINS